MALETKPAKDPAAEDKHELDPKRKAALDTALAQVEKSFGKGSAMRLGDQPEQNVEVISTGSLALDMALGIGGLPKGRIVEIYGPESSGKTTLALHVVANAQKKGGVAAYPVHRIDFNTEGLLLFAKTEEIRDLLGRLIRDRKISKSYLAVVLGKLEPGRGTLTHQIFKDAKKNQVFVTDEPVKGSKTAITEYERLAYRSGLSLVKCHLITGRTHQIRSQMAHVGHPLLGDDKYGVKTTNRSYKEKRQLLCSAEISCDFGKEAGPLSYLAGTRWSVGDVGFVKKYFGGR